MIPRDKETREQMLETVQGHVEAVLGFTQRTPCEVVTAWPDREPDTADAAASWNYITGYANALGATVPELVIDLGVWTET